MFKRKVQIAIFAALVLTFVGVLISTFSAPAPINVKVTFTGYTLAQSTGGQIGFQFTNASFFVSNAGPAKARLTFRQYAYKDGDSMILIRPSGLGILCILKPGHSTNLVIPMVPNINRIGGFGPDYNWRVEFTSRYDWLAKLDRQPKWLQNVVTKSIPQRWLADLYRADVVSDWVTNHEPAPIFPKLITP